MGRPGAGARSLAVRNHGRGERLQRGEKGGRLDRRGAYGKGVRGVQGKTGEGDTGECFARYEMGRRAREATTHGTGES